MTFFIFIALAALCNGVINNPPWQSSDEDLVEPYPACTGCFPPPKDEPEKPSINRAHIIPAADIRNAWGNTDMRAELKTYCGVDEQTDKKNKLYWCNNKPNWRPGDRQRNSRIGAAFDPAIEIAASPAAGKTDQYQWSAATKAALDLIKKKRGTYTGWTNPILNDEKTAIRNSGACPPTDNRAACRLKLDKIPEYAELTKFTRLEQELLVAAFPDCGYVVPAPVEKPNAWGVKKQDKSVAAILDNYPELTNVAILAALCFGALFGVYQLITRCGRKDELYYHSLVEHEDI